MVSSQSIEHFISDLSYIERDLSNIDLIQRLDNKFSKGLENFIHNLNIDDRSKESFLERSVEGENIDKILGVLKTIVETVSKFFAMVADFFKTIFRAVMKRLRVEYDKIIKYANSTKQSGEAFSKKELKNADFYIMSAFVDDKVHCLKGISPTFFERVNKTITNIMDKGKTFYDFKHIDDFTDHEKMIPVMEELVNFDPKTKKYLVEKVRENTTNGLDVLGFFSSVDPEIFCNSIMPVRKSVRMEEIIDNVEQLTTILDYANMNSSSMDKVINLCKQHGEKSKKLATSINSNSKLTIEEKYNEMSLIKLSVQASRGFSKVLQCFKNLYTNLSDTLRVIVIYVVKNKTYDIVEVNT